MSEELTGLQNKMASLKKVWIFRCETSWQWVCLIHLQHQVCCAGVVWQIWKLYQP